MMSLGRKVLSAITLTLLLAGMFTVAFSIQAVNAASGIIYIRADGSIDPVTAPISTLDNVTYTLTGDIFNASIVIERDNIVVDGAGYMILGTGMATDGVIISGRTGVTVENMTISDCGYGIYLDSSSGNSIVGNTITNTYESIRMYESSNNNISGNIVDSTIDLRYSSDNCIVGNTVTGNLNEGMYVYYSNNNSIVQNVITANFGWGIELEWSSGNDLVNNTVSGNIGWDGIFVYGSPNNRIVGNTIAANGGAGIFLGSPYSSGNSIVGNTIIGNAEGVVFSYCSNNNVYHNNFVNNSVQIDSMYGSVNVWDDGYPSGGNYWRDYNGTDMFGGAFQNETGSDKIGDTYFVIDENNTDRYPLMALWGIQLLGDINKDWVVDIFDAIILAGAYNSKPGDPNWKPNADINGDNAIDIYDAILLANHYNQHYP
jgi:parallel beta-helix repeat protein